MPKNQLSYVASYLVFQKDNKVLLLKRANTWFMDWMYSLVAWHVDEWESFTQAIIREWVEEAWVTFDTKHLNASHIMHRNSWNRVYVDVYFSITDWKWEITNIEPHKCDDLSRFDINNLPENTIPYVKSALENINNNIHFSEFWR